MPCPSSASSSLPAGWLPGFVSGVGGKTIGKALLEGMSGMAPGIPLLLMAASIKHIVTSGQVMDTILNSAAGGLQNASPLAAVLIILRAGATDRILHRFRRRQGRVDDAHPAAAGGPGGRHAPAHRYRLLLRRRLFQPGVSHQSGAAHHPRAGVGRLMANGCKFTWKLWLLVIPVTVFFLWLGNLIQYGPF